MTNKIPLARPYVGEEEVRAVSGVIRSKILSMGPRLQEFEDRFAKFIGSKYAVAVNSGTSGLHLCVKAFNIKAGDEIITTPFSFVASSNPIIFEGGRPVFVDIDERTYNIDPGKVKKAITKRTKAILLVHLFGYPCDMDEIAKISKETGIPVIEDACEAMGAMYNGRKVGTLAKAAVFAFYPNKQMTTGEGGMIVTNDAAIAKSSRSWRNQGRDDSGEWLNHVRIGYNYRLGEMNCAVGIEQLKKIKLILNERKKIAERYNKAFAGSDALITPYVNSSSERSWWVYYLRVRECVDRDRVIKYLNSNGVSSRGYFDPPIHLQPIYKRIFGFKGGEFPVSEKVAKSGFIIPLFVGMPQAQIKKVCITVIEAVRRAKI